MSIKLYTGKGNCIYVNYVLINLTSKKKKFYSQKFAHLSRNRHLLYSLHGPKEVEAT